MPFTTAVLRLGAIFANSVFPFPRPRPRGTNALVGGRFAMGYYLKPHAVAGCTPKTANPRAARAVSGRRFYSPSFGRDMSPVPALRSGRRRPYALPEDSTTILSRALPVEIGGDGTEDMIGVTRCSVRVTPPVVVEVRRETCAGNCTRRHEQIHVGQVTPCCVALVVACRTEPFLCAYYVGLYDEWLRSNDDLFECYAYIDSMACYMGVLGGERDCKCREEMDAELVAVAALKDDHCRHAPKVERPCPKFLMDPLP